MRKDEFIKYATLAVKANRKLEYIKLAYDNRNDKTTDASKPNFVEYRSLKDLFNFITPRMRTNVYTITQVWNYIRGNKPFDKPFNKPKT